MIEQKMETQTHRLGVGTMLYTLAQYVGERVNIVGISDKEQNEEGVIGSYEPQSNVLRVWKRKNKDIIEKSVYFTADKGVIKKGSHPMEYVRDSKEFLEGENLLLGVGL